MVPKSTLRANIKPAFTLVSILVNDENLNIPSVTMTIKRANQYVKHPIAILMFSPRTFVSAMVVANDVECPNASKPQDKMVCVMRMGEK